MFQIGVFGSVCTDFVILSDIDLPKPEIFKDLMKRRKTSGRSDRISIIHLKNVFSRHSLTLTVGKCKEIIISENIF